MGGLAFGFCCLLWVCGGLFFSFLASCCSTGEGLGKVCRASGYSGTYFLRGGRGCFKQELKGSPPQPAVC